MVTPQQLRTDPVVTRCHTPVPEPLRGVFETAKCTLVTGPHGTHDGHHKASITIPGYGKITWRWKNRNVPKPPTFTAPVPLRGRRPV